MTSSLQVFSSAQTILIGRLMRSIDLGATDYAFRIWFHRTEYSWVYSGTLRANRKRRWLPNSIDENQLRAIIEVRSTTYGSTPACGLLTLTLNSIVNQLLESPMPEITEYTLHVTFEGTALPGECENRRSKTRNAFLRSNSRQISLSRVR